MNRYIKLDSENRVISIRFGTEKVNGEIESANGDIGHIMETDGTFTTPEREPETQQPTLEDKVNYLYYKEMGLFG